jgi:hypothetical protein
MPAIPPKGHPQRATVITQLVGFIGLPVLFIAIIMVVIFS